MDASSTSQGEMPAKGSGPGMNGGSGSDAGQAIKPALAGLIRELEQLGVAQPPRMTIVCSWCKQVQDEGDGFSQVSHTICPACRERYFPHGAAVSLEGASR